MTWAYLIMIVSLITMTNIGCIPPEREKTADFFIDFDVLKRQGIGKLSHSELVSRMQRKLKVYQLTYRSSVLDSVVIFNPYKNSDPMKLSLICENSVCVYETVYPYWGGIGYKCYYVVKPLQLDMYIQLEDGWDVRTIKKDTSFGRLKDIFNDNDSTGFKHKLLTNEPIKLRNMAAHDLHIYNNRLSNHFTFTNWLTYGVLK